MISFNEAKQKEGKFKDVFYSLNNLIAIAEFLPEIMDYYHNPYEKKENTFIEYQHKESAIERVLFRDRKIPVDTVLLNEFNRNTGADIENVKLEYGPNSDEYVRSHHALAIAIADTIYIRNGAYSLENEDGRKLLTHELTHIAQNKEKETYRNVSNDEKEIEAEKNENTQTYNPDTLITKNINGKSYILKDSEWRKINSLSMKYLEERILLLKNSLTEKEYLKLLLQYQKWIELEGSKWEV